MRRIAMVILTLGLLSNVGIGLYQNNVNITSPGTDDTGGNGEDENPVSDIVELVVPDIRLGDQVTYDYGLFAEMYWENKTSGEWGKYTFKGEGELLQYVDEITDITDGFQISHNSVKMAYDTRAHFDLTMSGSEKDTITIPGNLDIARSEFNNLFDKHQIMSHNAGSIAIEGLGQWGQKTLDVEYVADLRTYSDPSAEPTESLDDAIYAEGQTLTLDSTGTFEPDGLSDGNGGEVYFQKYDWKVEGAYELNERDAMKINVTSSFWDFLSFKRIFYISGDSPFPLKGFTRTNTSFEDEEGVFYIILETTRELKSDSSLRIGTEPIPWGSTKGHNEYIEEHPAGQYETWLRAPSDGTEVEYSSFAGFPLSQAMSFAEERSEGLSDFLDEFDRKGTVLVDSAVFNETDIDLLGKNTTQFWNISYAYVATSEEYHQYRRDYGEWPEWAYRINIARSIETDLQGNTVESIYIFKDEGDDRHGLTNGAMSETDLKMGTKLLTTTHAEKIFRVDDEIKAMAFKNNNLKKDINFTYTVLGINSDNNPGMTLIQQLTGLSMPTSDNAYVIQAGQVRTGGSTYSAAVDANTGQLLYVTDIEGSELASIFGGG